MKYEKYSQPLVPVQVYALRVLNNILFATVVIAIALAIGVIGYHHFGQLPWVDSLLNASMILGGMGPVDLLKTDAAKVFASMYALFSGVVFLTVVALTIAPILHRFLHRLHIEENQS
ncbi:MAG: hypothetical protein ABIV51_09790 [Saprospiraceae bacterium]